MSLYPTHPPPPNTRSLRPNPKKRKACMFPARKVVENTFRLNIPSDPRMVDIHLFVGITLVIKHNSAKIALSLRHVTLAHAPISYPFSISQPTSATCLSSIYVKIIWKLAISVRLWTLSPALGAGGEKENPPFITHFRLSSPCTFQLRLRSCRCGHSSSGGVWRGMQNCNWEKLFECQVENL